MALRTICVYPDPVLREETASVTEFDEELKTLVGDMFDTMYANDGIGLAAPQVGVAKRIVVIDYHGDKFVLVNPEVVEAEGSVINEEGCLSFPGIYEKVASPEKLTVVYQDENGVSQRRELDGFCACFLTGYHPSSVSSSRKKSRNGRRKNNGPADGWLHGLRPLRRALPGDNIAPSPPHVGADERSADGGAWP